MSENFAQVVVVDFEFEIDDGDLPRPLCMVAHLLDENLQHVRTIRLWRGEFDSRPPFDIGHHTVVVGYNLSAEMTCFSVLNWQFPTHLFDQYTAYLAASNILRPHDPDEIRRKERKRLSDACRAYGLEGWERIDKEVIAKDIGGGRWQKYGRDAVLAYCEEDVVMSVKLLRAQLRRSCDQRGHTLLPAADVERVLWWSNYSAKAVALIQMRGMPIDVTLWNLVQENKQAVIRELRRQFDPSYGTDVPIFDSEGGWTYARLEWWLVHSGITYWPCLASGQLDTSNDAWKLMHHIPGIEGLHALRDSLRVIANADLPLGRDGRNRPSLFPFGTTTGRNAHTKSLFNAHAAMRSFMKIPPGSVAGYLDWRSQEVGVAAARSDDSNLKADFAGGDIYHALADLCGLNPDPDPVRWKRENPDTRNRMKVLQLGINYGMGVPSLARGLGRHPLIASEIIERHRRRYTRFWQWRENAVQLAMLDRRSESIFGWPLHLSSSPNRRTLYNFPMQSGGAEMLRLSTIRLCEAGIVPIMLVHDGILFEETDKERIEHAREIMLQAGRDVCDGFEIGVDVDQILEGGARYRDKRPMAIKMWATIMRVLQAVGALPKQDAA